MSETHQIQNSSGSIPSSEKIEDTFRRMNVNEDNVEQCSAYPDRPGERDCQFFMRTGLCGYGNNCRFNHPHNVVYHKEKLPERIGQPDCEYYLKTGACKYGSTCKYHHPKDRNGAGPVLFNVLGYPMRQGEKSCPYYMQTGTCRFGVACKFHHPHPRAHNSHSPYGMSTFPSVGFPYAGGLTMMSMPPATYGAMPRPRPYMPFMIAPSQGLLPPQGWAPYMAASNSVYNLKTQPDSSSSASLPVGVTSHHHSFSETAECRYFMNTGTCRYGDECKYKHPRERILQALPPNLSNPIALPARPGQPACGNFKAYGFCKFGANCKFDHSMPLNPYNNVGLTMPTDYSSPVSTHTRVSSLPSRSDSTTFSNGKKPAEENHNSEIEKEEDTSSQPDKLIVQLSSSPLIRSDAESPSSETKKQYDNPAKPDNSEVTDSSDQAS